MIGLYHAMWECCSCGIVAVQVGVLLDSGKRCQKLGVYAAWRLDV